jgi:hypothetical protein
MAKSLKEFDTLSVALDARSGHGYGKVTSSPGLGTNTKSGDGFPYDVSDIQDLLDDDDGECDDDTPDPFDSMKGVDKFMSKIDTSYYAPHDPYGKRRARVDRSSFAHSSTRGLGEAVASGMVPFPDLYKNREAPVGGMAPNAFKTGPGKTGGGGRGSKKGYASPPPADDLSDEFNPDELDDLLSSDELALARAKKSHDKLVKEFFVLFTFERKR